MLVYAIDDEQGALDELCEALSSALPDARIKRFHRAVNALDALRGDDEKPQIVFSDIRMPGMDGLAFAVNIKKDSPDTVIIFVTGYTDYALNAFRVHADGYLTKPVLPEHIRKEVEHMRSRPLLVSNKLRVQCFGNFGVFWNNRPLIFGRKQAKELFAYLVDREGAFATTDEIAAALWEDETNIKKVKNNLRNLVADLKKTLAKIGQSDILLRERGSLAVNRNAIDCDYYHMLDGDVRAVNSFRGEYMSQYTWAEMTTAKLYFHTT